MKALPAFVALVGLMSCAAPALEVTSPIATASMNASFPNERVGDYVRTTLRTYVKDGQTGDKVEVAGLDCRVFSEEFSLRAVSPAYLMLPSFVQRETFDDRGKPSALNVQCQGNGYAGTYQTTAGNIGRDRPDAQHDGQIFRSSIGGGQVGSDPWGFRSELEIIVTRQNGLADE